MKDNNKKYKLEDKVVLVTVINADKKVILQEIAQTPNNKRKNTKENDHKSLETIRQIPIPTLGTMTANLQTVTQEINQLEEERVGIEVANEVPEAVEADIVMIIKETTTKTKTITMSQKSQICTKIETIIQTLTKKENNPIVAEEAAFEEIVVVNVVAEKEEEAEEDVGEEANLINGIKL
jgi:vacuolar-type H+-ATPase subunit I/STV1